MNPNEILGVAADVSEEELRAAWVKKVKEFPPDRTPAEFEKIRDAYNTLRDPRRRARMRLFSVAFSLPLVGLVDGRKAERVFVGPQPWREVLKTK